MNRTSWFSDRFLAKNQFFGLSVRKRDNKLPLVLFNQILLPKYHLSTFGVAKYQKIFSFFPKEDIFFRPIQKTSGNVTKIPGFR